ncbi:alkaline-phosphatase-like protein [Hyaloraphidium curvatum]|nr:alkaline-phosphatase-like protein [Hyaloraphidium curvatum]
MDRKIGVSLFEAPTRAVSQARTRRTFAKMPRVLHVAVAALAALALSGAQAGLAPPHDEMVDTRTVDPAQWFQNAENEVLAWWNALTTNASSVTPDGRLLARQIQQFLAEAGPSTSASGAGDKAASATTKGDVNKPRPNFVIVLVDDMDLMMGSLDVLPKIRKVLREEGTEFRNHFVTCSVCCPSRMSLLTGMFAHSTNFTDVVAPGGGWERMFKLGLTDISLPKYLNDAGYTTAFFGKLVNQYLPRNFQLVPPGWDLFDSLVNPWMYNFYQTVMAKNGDTIKFYPKKHQSDIITSKATTAIRDAARMKKLKKDEGVDKPFFLYVAPTMPHTETRFKATGEFPDPPIPFTPQQFLRLLIGNMGDTGGFSGPGMSDQGGNPMDGRLLVPGVVIQTTEVIPAERHRHLFPDSRVPRDPNFNPDVQDKPGWIGKLPKLNQTRIDRMDHWYRQRLRGLMSVDDMVGDIVDTLQQTGELDNTYILFTSDNGWHLGLHRLGGGKLTPYEHDIRVPMLVRGPGVPKNHVSKDVTTHTDIAPTLLKLAGIPLPDHFDGAPMPLHGEAKDGEKLEAFGVEYWIGLLDEEASSTVNDNNYKSVRYISKSGRNYLYTVRCEGHERELYDLSKDPYELRNAVRDPAYATLVDRLDALLQVLRGCAGKTCREPWLRYHPDGSVRSLDDAMDAKHDGIYRALPKVTFRECNWIHDLYREGLSDEPGATVRLPDKPVRPAQPRTAADLAAAGWTDAPVEKDGLDLRMPKARARM